MKRVIFSVVLVTSLIACGKKSSNSEDGSAVGAIIAHGQAIQSKCTLQSVGPAQWSFGVVPNTQTYLCSQYNPACFVYMATNPGQGAPWIIKDTCPTPVM